MATNSLRVVFAVLAIMIQSEIGRAQGFGDPTGQLEKPIGHETTRDRFWDLIRQSKDDDLEIVINFSHSPSQNWNTALKNGGLKEYGLNLKVSDSVTVGYLREELSRNAYSLINKWTPVTSQHVCNLTFDFGNEKYCVLVCTDGFYVGERLAKNHFFSYELAKLLECAVRSDKQEIDANNFQILSGERSNEQKQRRDARFEKNVERRFGVSVQKPETKGGKRKGTQLID